MNAALYALFAALSVADALRSDGIAFFWPASGIAVGAIILTPKAIRCRMLAAVFVTSAAVNYAFGVSGALSLWYSVANTVEIFVVCRIACIGELDSTWLDKPRWVARFGFGSLAGSLVSGSLATLSEAGNPGAAAFFLSWWSTVLLGLMIVGPLYIAVYDLVRRGGQFRASSHETLPALLFALAICLSMLAFWQESMPLLYLPFAAAMMLTFVYGPFGAVGAVFITACIGSYFTTAGDGPLTFVEGGPLVKAVYFQVYLLVTLATALPVATLLAQSRAAATQIAKGARLLSNAERKAHVGHWRLDLRAKELFWSDEVFAIHALAVGTPPTLDQAIEAYHPADRDMVAKAIAKSIDSREPFSFEARIIRPDGEIRHVDSNGEPEIEDGEVIAMFGVILDTTERADTLRQLRVARNEAQARARQALKLAETDELTGIASRRKFMERLNADIEAAETDSGSLALIMFDIDHFKAFNDTHGHAFGDLVLKLVAREAASCIRGKDLIGRIGGEEFAIVMPGVGHDIAEQVAERVRRSVGLLSVPDEFGNAQNVSVSLGIGTWKTGADEVWLMQAADNALYEAKRAGRNCLRHAA